MRAVSLALPVGFALTFASALAGCAGMSGPPVEKAMTTPDWANGDGYELNKQFAWDMRGRLLARIPVDAHAELVESGYECLTGEAHENYPDPARVCTRSFATRACQMDWEVSFLSERGRVVDVDAAFKRDCVGLGQDWPTPVKSAIDDQLAPTPALQPAPSPKK